MPSVTGDSANVSLSAFVAPEMTAVSNPKSSPPNAATRELSSRYPLSDGVVVTSGRSDARSHKLSRPLSQSNPG